MPQEDSKKCRICSVVLTETNKVKGQRLCRNCNSTLCKEYKKNNKKIISEYNKVYKKEHQKEIQTYNQNYNITNRDTIQKRHTAYLRNKRKTDINYKLAVNCRNKIKKMIKTNYSSLKLVGCSPDFLKKWLQFNFKPGMTFDNYGTYWHIDHVVPCYHFDLNDDNQLKKCFHWSNLQPLEATKNLQKKEKLDRDEVINHWLMINIFGYRNNIEVKQFNLTSFVL
jgi:hypothetical protein